MHREYDPAHMGLPVVVAGGHDRPGSGHGHDHGAAAVRAEHRRLVWLTIVVGLLLAGHLLLPLWNPAWGQLAGIPLGLLAAVIGGGRIIYLALSALLDGRIGADIALAIATIAAAVMGEYFVAAEVVFIALIGECLEAYAFGRAQRAIQKLLDLRPRMSRVLRDGVEREIPIEELRKGDVIVVRPGERITADGVVSAGRSAVDQSPLTGEAMPVDKGVGDPVYTGTINAFGRLEIRVEAVGDETTLGQVVRLLAQAQARKSPLEKTADRYARLFLPAVLIAAAVVFLGTNFQPLWILARTGVLPGKLDVLPTLAVLVVACPCALILATPAAVLAATARLARRGVLVKGGQAIEQLARVDCLAFDKTGTLTEGRPELGDVHTFGSLDPRELLRLAAAAEQSSEHPLARLLVAEARRAGLTLPPTSEFQAHPGAGVSAVVEDRRLVVGNPRLFREHQIELTGEGEAALAGLDESGQTALLVSVDGVVCGVVGARDRIRAEAHDIIEQLKEIGLDDLTILTGDRPAAARAIARALHLDQVEAERTPADKVSWVQDRQRAGRVVAMVGDGINDAPALALADVGIALGGVGTDIAAEAGSIVLMGDPLAPLPDAVKLARRTVRIIRQNILIFAFGLNAVAVILAGLRVLGPVAAAIVHQVGSFLVILNAIRLLGAEGWRQFAPVRAAQGVVGGLRAARGFDLGGWVGRHVRSLAAFGAMAGLLAYAATGLVRIGPEQVGLVQRFGQLRAPALGPGLHVRWPMGVERVIRVEPAQVRVARVGLVGKAEAGSASIAWSASHGDQRDEGALFLTGDDNLMELAGVVEYHLGDEELDRLVFGVAAVDRTVAAVSEAVFREVAASSGLEDWLVNDRGGLERRLEARLQRQLSEAGVPVRLDHVRIVDAHPPREVVPAFRDVASAVSDAARYLNEAQAYAAEQEWSAQAESGVTRDLATVRGEQIAARGQGERGAFLAQQAVHALAPELTRFRMLSDVIAARFAGHSKVILDPKAAGRRQIWMTGPEQFGLGGLLAAPAAGVDTSQWPSD